MGEEFQFNALDLPFSKGSGREGNGRSIELQEGFGSKGGFHLVVDFKESQAKACVEVHPLEGGLAAVVSELEYLVGVHLATEGK